MVIYIWTKQRAGTNYNYNIFDDPEHSTVDKLAFRNIHFSIPSKLKGMIKTDSGYAQSKGEHILFEQGKGQLLGKFPNLKI